MNNELVDRVQNDGQDEHLPNVLSTLSQQLGSISTVRESSPKESPSAVPRVIESCADRDEDSHCRLNDQSEIHRAGSSAVEVVPYALKHLIHFDSAKSCSKSSHLCL